MHRGREREERIGAEREGTQWGGERGGAEGGRGTQWGGERGGMMEEQRERGERKGVGSSGMAGDRKFITLNSLISFITVIP